MTVIKMGEKLFKKLMDYGTDKLAKAYYNKPYNKLNNEQRIIVLKKYRRMFKKAYSLK